MYGALGILLVLFCPLSAHAWPLDAEWFALTKSASGLTDLVNDSQGGANDPRDIVTSTSTYTAAYVFNDGTHMYFRIRVDGDALNNQGTALQPFGWGFLIDTDNDFSDYEWMIMLNGIANPDTIELSQNVNQGTPGDPSDKTEVTVWTEPWQLNVNFRSIAADSTTNGGQDYFLDFRIPYATFKAKTGLTDTSPIRFFIGSSSSAQSLTADLVDISNTCSTNLAQCMSTNATDATTPLGTYPATGSVMFVSNIAGSGDVSAVYSGQTIYVKVTDQDVNTIKSTAQILSVVIATQTGDSESLSLTETGADTGIFTGSIATAAGAPIPADDTLQVNAIETVTASYIDAVDAAYNTYQTRSDTLTVQKAADLAVTKTADKTTPGEGEALVYTISVTNNGPNNATGIQVTDTLPAGITWVSDSGAGTYNHTTGVWGAPSLANGASASLNITVTVDAGTQNTTISNSASITASAIFDPDSGNNAASKAVTVGGADLALTKTVSNASPPSGGAVSYTVTVTNNGSSNAGGIAVTDSLPAGLAYASSASTQGSYDSATGVWSIGGLATGATCTLTLDATVTAGVGVSVTNTASITASDQADPNTGNNTASTSVFVSGVDLSITKIVNNTIPNESSSVTYTLTVTNNGLYSANSITVTDILPAGLTYQSSAGAGTYASGTGLWSVGTVVPGGTAVRSISAQINTGTSGQTITNTATITGSSLGDPDATNNTAGASVAVQQADLAVTKTASNPSPNSNQAFSYSVVITNNGPHPATNITVRDTLDTTNVTYNSAAPSMGSVSYAAPVLIWAIPGPVANGASVTLTINVTAKSNTNGETVHNMAEIISASEADPVNANNTAIETIVIGVGTTDLAITKTVNNSAPVAGTPVTFTIIVSNPSGTNAANVVVSDLLPAGVSYASSTVTQGGYNSGSGAWSVGTVNAGASAALTLTATVNAGTTGQTITNTATITSQTQLDLDLSNNADSTSIMVGATDLAITKTVDNGTSNEGSPITYTVTVTNNGPNNATTVRVTDLLPAGLNYSSSLASTGAYVSGTGLWSIAALASGATGTLTISATVDAGTAGSVLTNTASRTSADQADTVAANNSASAAITVQSADLYITKTVSTSTPSQGGSVVYTLTVGNSGPHNATGVIVSDILPAGLTYVSDNGGGAYNSGTGMWTVGSVAKNAVQVLTITAMVDTGGVTIVNPAGITAHDQADPNVANNSASVSITSVSMPQIIVLKTVFASADPVNGSMNPKAIPGATMQYSVIVTNTGGGTAQTVVVTDPVPPNTELFVSDLAVPGSGPVTFSDGAVASGVMYSFGGLSNIFDCLSFSNDGGATYTYTPVPDANGFDSQVTGIKVTPTGTFNAASGGNNPSFSLQFKVRVK
jgi:uncharacterized repeat protein (TIGR01451 family)